MTNLGPDENGGATEPFDSPEAIMEMRRRHLRIALEMQQLAARGLAELRERGELTAEECATLLDAAAKLQRSAVAEKEPDDATIPPRKPN